MSELHEQLAASAGEIIRVQAAGWILKRRSADSWSGEDQLALDAWLGESTAHLLAYLRLEAAWKQTDRLAALRGSARLEEAPALRRPFLTRLAAVVSVIAITGLVAAYYLARPQERVFSTGVGGHERVTLADGTFIELNTDTAIRIANNATARTVYLDRGEAFFQVKHDAAHPFMVIADGRRITDIGTAFDVRRGQRALAVAMVEGRARFDTPQNPSFRSLNLKPGDQVVATASGVSRTEKPIDELTKQLSWRRGMLVFYGTTLAQAATEFNRYSDTKLVIADPKVGALKINGTFQSNNVEAFVDATQVVLGLKLDAHDNEIVISK
jgi:transmembrane sensor